MLSDYLNYRTIYKLDWMRVQFKLISILEMELIFCCVKERDDLMVNIIKQEIDIEETLKSKLEMIELLITTLIK